MENYIVCWIGRDGIFRSLSNSQKPVVFEMKIATCIAASYGYNVMHVALAQRLAYKLNSDSERLSRFKTVDQVLVELDL